MTVTTTANSITYVGNGATTAFAFPYIFFDDSDLVVSLFDAGGVPVSSVLNGAAPFDYTVSGAYTNGEYASGASVTFNTAPPGGYLVVILRAVPALQPVTLIDNTKFPAATVNTEFDRLTVLAQQSLTITGRVLRVDDIDLDPLPPTAARAGKVVSFTGSGQPTVVSNVPVSPAIVLGSFWQTALLTSDAEQAREALGAQRAFAADVLDFGADPTGAANSGPAFQAAIDWAVAHGGGLVIVPPGLFRLTTPITITDCVSVQGEGWSETIPGIHADWGGTWLNITQTAAPAFTLVGGAARGTAFRNFGITQPHPAPGPGWAPTTYAPVFLIDDILGEVYFEDLYFAGIYIAVDSQLAGRTTMRRIRGQTFSRFLVMDNDGPSDTNHVDDIHIWPYWSSHADVYAWQHANGIGIWLGRVDSIQADHIFILGYKAAIQTQGHATQGPPTGVAIGSLNADACVYAIWDTYTAFTFGYGTDIHIQHLHHGGATTAANTIQLDGKGARIQVDQLAPVQVHNALVNITYTGPDLGNMVQIGVINGQGSGANWNVSGTSPAFNAVGKTGAAHTIRLASPIVPATGGFTNGGLVSGLVNDNTANGAAIVYDAGNQTWRNPTVVNAGVYKIPNWCTLFLAGGGAVITSITYELPDQAPDGRQVTIVGSSGQGGVVFTSAAGIVNPPTSTLAGIGTTFTYLAQNIVWVRTG